MSPLAFFRLACTATVLVGAELALAGPSPLNALLVTGGCCHDYDTQTGLITEGLSERVAIMWTVVRGPDSRDAEFKLYQDPDWADGFDVVVHNECYGGVVNVKYVENVARPHFNGTPGVVIHCSMHSYRNAATDEWRRCVGVTSFRHEAHRPLTVETLDETHPIMSGFPQDWQTPNGELYIIERLWPEAQPLASAFGQDTGQDHTVVWTNTYGTGRIFGTTLGHHNETVSHTVYLDLLARGLLWTCHRLDRSPEFVRGNCSGDESVMGEITNAVFLLSYNFMGGKEPGCLAACDANGDGQVHGAVSDAVYLLLFNFLGGQPPMAPFPDCGPGNENDEALGCETPSCQ